MQLILKNTGPTASFVSWLKGFKDIHNTILIEVDLTEKKFIAKCFTESRNIVKYSDITFENAGYEMDSLSDNDGNSLLTIGNELEASYTNIFTGDNRIKIGLYDILSNIIDVALMYVDVEHTITLNFDLANNVKYVGGDKAMKQYQSEKLIFGSKTLTMTINCTVLTEFFRFLDDNTFMNVCKLGNEMSCNVTPETISNLNRISQLFKSEKTRSAIKFYTQQESGSWALYALDELDSRYNYLLGYYADGQKISESAEIVLRENFITATKAINTDMQIIMSANKSAKRILITTENCKIVVAAQQL